MQRRARPLQHLQHRAVRLHMSIGSPSTSYTPARCGVGAQASNSRAHMAFPQPVTVRLRLALGPHAARIGSGRALANLTSPVAAPCPEVAPALIDLATTSSRSSRLHASISNVLERRPSATSIAFCPEAWYRQEPVTSSKAARHFVQDYPGWLISFPLSCSFFFSIAGRPHSLSIFHLCLAWCIASILSARRRAGLILLTPPVLHGHTA